jgi:hypothetical protein
VLERRRFAYETVIRCLCSHELELAAQVGGTYVIAAHPPKLAIGTDAAPDTTPSGEGASSRYVLLCCPIGCKGDHGSQLKTGGAGCAAAAAGGWTE